MEVRLFRKSTVCSEHSLVTHFLIDITGGVLLCVFKCLKHLSVIFSSPISVSKSKEGLGIYFVPVKIIFILVYLMRANFSTFVSF